MAIPEAESYFRGGGRYFIPTTLPSGEAPPRIRAHWIGLPLPLQDDVDNPRQVTAIGVMSGEPDLILEAVTVPTSWAIAVLRYASREDAATWWEKARQLPAYEVGDTLFFRASEGEILTGHEILQTVYQQGLHLKRTEPAV